MAGQAAVLDGLSGLVTGGARGLGKAMTDALLAAGARVVVADIAPDPSTADHERLVTVRADVSRPEDADHAVRTCLDRFGSLDFLINNAGVLMREARRRTGISGYVNFWDVDPDTVRFFLDVHVVGSFLMSRLAAPYMRAKGRGRIITVSTSFSTMLGGSRTPYGPAKAAMEAFAAVMANDLAGTGVTVNILIPGHAKPGPDGIPPPTNDQRGPDGARIEPRVPTSIMGPPAVWLASDASAGLTGHRIIAIDWDPTVAPETALGASAAPIAWASLDR